LLNKKNKAKAAQLKRKPYGTLETVVFYIADSRIQTGNTYSIHQNDNKKPLWKKRFPALSLSTIRFSQRRQL